MRREDHPACHQGLASPSSTHTHTHFIEPLTQPSRSLEPEEARSRSAGPPVPSPPKRFSNLPLLKQKTVNAPCCIFYLNKKMPADAVFFQGSGSGVRDGEQLRVS